MKFSCTTHQQQHRKSIAMESLFYRTRCLVVVSETRQRLFFTLYWTFSVVKKEKEGRMRLLVDDDGVAEKI